jgi:hypothetical protein
LLVISTVEGEHTAAGLPLLMLAMGLPSPVLFYDAKHPVANSLLIWQVPVVATAAGVVISDAAPCIG